MIEKINKYKIYLLIIPIVIIGSVVIYSVTKENNNDEITVLEPLEEITEEKVEPIPTKTIKVDIKGEVNNPGVYELEEGKRVSDVINKSGGLTENADTTLINLSKNLKDEMVIVIYNKSEIEKLRKDLTTTKTVIEYIEKECSCPDTINDACIKPAETKNNQKNTNAANSNVTTQNNTESVENTKININTATKEELMTVSGIGETKADAIIKYRTEKGMFNDINEITNVSGIGESTFEKIKDNITI